MYVDFRSYLHDNQSFESVGELDVFRSFLRKIERQTKRKIGRILVSKPNIIRFKSRSDEIATTLHRNLQLEQINISNRIIRIDKQQQAQSYDPSYSNRSCLIESNSTNRNEAPELGNRELGKTFCRENDYLDPVYTIV